MTLFLVVASLAVARAVRLVVDDTLLDKPRNWLLPKLGPYLRKLVTCPWCLSAWITAAVVIWYWATRGLRMPLLCYGAVWYGAVTAYWFTETLSGWHGGPDDLPDPKTAQTVNSFWAARSNEELPERPPLPKSKRWRNR